MSQNSQDDDSNQDSDEDIIEVSVEPVEPKIKSLKEAMSMLEDVTKYLTYENLTDAADSVSKVLSSVQSVWLHRKQKLSLQSKLTDYL